MHWLGQDTAPCSPPALSLAPICQERRAAVAGCSFSSTPSGGCACRDNASQCITHSVSFLNLLKEALQHNPWRQRANTSGAAVRNLPVMPPAKRCTVQPAPAPGQGGQGDGSCTGEPEGRGAAGPRAAPPAVAAWEQLLAQQLLAQTQQKVPWGAEIICYGGLYRSARDTTQACY